MMKRIRFALALALGTVAVGIADAAVYTILPDKAGKWNEATSYSEGTGTPGAGDAVLVPAGTDVAANAADIQFLETAAVGSIAFGKGKVNPTLTVTVGSDQDVSFGGVITNCADRFENTYVGTLIKNGSGTLRLTQTGDIQGLRISLTVNGGILALPAGVSSANRNMHFNKIIVNAPGVLWPSTGTKQQANYFNGGLWGDGVVSNPVANVSTVILNGSPTFSGRLDGNLYVSVRSSSTLTGTDSFNTASLHDIRGKTLTLAAIGGTYGENSNPGTLGSTAYYQLQGNSTIAYGGTGEVSYADFRANDEFGTTFTLNGGATGGFDHRGRVSFTAATGSEATLILTGDHTNACTLASLVTNDLTRTTRLTKRGTGTWTVAPEEDGSVNGTVTVEDGTLAFDSLMETNSPCALGYANALTDGKAVVLGTSSTTGALEYVGTTAASAATRMLALAGDGRLTSATATLAWSGVTSADAESHTLVVGGAADGTLRNVSDGDGKVNIVKEGAGSWTLGGDLDFTGGLDVKAGSLVLSSATNYFTWYRYLVQEMFTNNWSSADQLYVDPARFNLFNAAGAAQVPSDKMTENTAAWRATEKLQPGEAVAYTTHPTIKLGNLVMSSNPLSKLFSTATGTAMYRLQPYGSDNPASQKFRPMLDDPQSWVGCVLRLPADADPIISYDVGNRWDVRSDDNFSKRASNTPNCWRVEGSVDGVNWQTLDTVVSNDTRRYSNYWRFAGKAYSATNTAGHKILSGIAPTVSLDRGLDDVSVAAGATLSTTMDVTVRKITIDAAGMGSLSGVSLAEGGVIDIVNAPTRGSFDVVADLTDVTLPANYTFMVNGAIDRRKVELSSDSKRISLKAPGTVILLR